jgi:hypothetical protein
MLKNASTPDFQLPTPKGCLLGMEVGTWELTAVRFRERERVMETDPRGRYADVNGLKMYYEIHGSGPPLVLLHGAFETAERWTRLVSKLWASCQIIIVEQRGHGHTADRNTPLSLAAITS